MASYIFMNAIIINMLTTYIKLSAIDNKWKKLSFFFKQLLQTRRKSLQLNSI